MHTVTSTRDRPSDECISYILDKAEVNRILLDIIGDVKDNRALSGQYLTYIHIQHENELYYIYYDFKAVDIPISKATDCRDWLSQCHWT